LHTQNLHDIHKNFTKILQLSQTLVDGERTHTHTQNTHKQKTHTPKTKCSFFHTRVHQSFMCREQVGQIVVRKTVTSNSIHRMNTA